MAGKFDLREVGSILLDMTSENWESVPEGSARLRFNADQGSLQLEYLSPTFMSVNTTLASGESAVLAQNFLSSQTITPADVGGKPLGAVYLPSGILDVTSSAYLMVSGTLQSQVTSTLTISLYDTPAFPNLPPPNPLASFQISWSDNPGPPTVNYAYGDCLLTPAAPVALSRGWYFLAVSGLDNSTEGFVGGVRLVVIPTP